MQLYYQNPEPALAGEDQCCFGSRILQHGAQVLCALGQVQPQQKQGLRGAATLWRTSSPGSLRRQAQSSLRVARSGRPEIVILGSPRPRRGISLLQSELRGARGVWHSRCGKEPLSLIGGGPPSSECTGTPAEKHPPSRRQPIAVLNCKLRQSPTPSVCVSVPESGLVSSSTQTTVRPV